MTSLQYRRRHLSKPVLEMLDERVVPSAAGSALHGQAMEAHAIRVAEIRAARAEHLAQVREMRLERLEARAEHRAELRAERVQLLQARAEHRAQLRAERAARLFPAAATNFQFGATNHVMVNSSTASSMTPANAGVQTQAGLTPSAAPVSNAGIVSINPSNTVPPLTDPTNSVTTGATTPGDPSDVKNGPLAKAGQDLITVYTQFEAAGESDDFTLTGPLASIIRIQGNTVGVDVGTAPSNISAMTSTLTGLGMQITATDPTTGKIEGFLPIAQLPAVAQNPDVLTIGPNYVPTPPPNPPSDSPQPR